MNDIETERRRRGWSTGDLSRHAGVHERTVRRAEAGDTVSWAMRRRLLTAMDIPLHVGEPPSEERVARSIRTISASRRETGWDPTSEWFVLIGIVLLSVFVPPMILSWILGFREFVASDAIMPVLILVQMWAASGSGEAKAKDARRALGRDIRIVLEGMAYGDPGRVPRAIVERIACVVGWREVVAYANAVRSPPTDGDPEASQKEVAALSGVSTRTLRRMDGGEKVSEETRRRVEAARASLRPSDIAVPRDDRYVEALALLAPAEPPPIEIVDRLVGGWLPVVVVGAVASAWWAGSILLGSASTDSGLHVGAIAAVLSILAVRGWRSRRVAMETAVRLAKAREVVAEGIRSGELRFVPNWSRGGSATGMADPDGVDPAPSSG